jgi:hypothetical protein
MVEEDLWDLGPKWKSKADAAPANERPDATKLDTTVNTAATSVPTPIQERLAGNKSVTSFRDTFGRDLDSDDVREADKLAAMEAAKPQEDLIGTQFIFSKEQLHREHERALNGSESDGKSMSTAGKTTCSTRLALKEAQEQIAELKLALTATKTPFQAVIDKTVDEDIMDINSPPASVEHRVPSPDLPPAPAAVLPSPKSPPKSPRKSPRKAKSPRKVPKRVQMQDTPKEISDAQLL